MTWKSDLDPYPVIATSMVGEDRMTFASCAWMICFRHFSGFTVNLKLHRLSFNSTSLGITKRHLKCAFIYYYHIFEFCFIFYLLFNIICFIISHIHKIFNIAFYSKFPVFSFIFMVIWKKNESNTFFSSRIYLYYLSKERLWLASLLEILKITFININWFN